MLLSCNRAMDCQNEILNSTNQRTTQRRQGMLCFGWVLIWLYPNASDLYCMLVMHCAFPYGCVCSITYVPAAGRVSSFLSHSNVFKCRDLGGLLIEASEFATSPATHAAWTISSLKSCADMGHFTDIESSKILWKSNGCMRLFSLGRWWFNAICKWTMANKLNSS